MRRLQRRGHARTPSATGGVSGNLGSSIDGEFGFYLGNPGPSAVSGGAIKDGSARSTIKVPIAVAVLQRAGGPSQASASQLDPIDKALTSSDNEAAATLFNQLVEEGGGIEEAAAAVTAVLRRAGDETAIVSTRHRDRFSPYGQTDWSLREQARFLAALEGGCVSSVATRAYILDLMGHVSSDLWGLGSLTVPARWKGGWGPDPSGRYLVRQMGLIELDDRSVPIVLAAEPADGSLASGQSAASELAQELAPIASQTPSTRLRC